MDLVKLNEILAGGEYTGLSSEDAAALANNKRHVKQKEYRVKYLGLASLVGVDVVKRLISTLDTMANSDVLIREVREDLKGAGSGIDVGHPVTRALLTQFGAATNLPLTASDATLIKDLANIMESDADQKGIGSVKAGHVEEARRLIG